MGDGVAAAAEIVRAELTSGAVLEYNQMSAGRQQIAGRQDDPRCHTPGLLPLVCRLILMSALLREG